MDYINCAGVVLIIGIQICCGAVSSQLHNSSNIYSQKRNAIAVRSWLWKNNRVPYVIDNEQLEQDAVIAISNAVHHFNTKVSCVKFVPRVNEFDYVRFKNGKGCQSSIGRDGGEQTISIGPACLYQGVIMHEMTHAVGFFHEQNRWDRDSYVSIHWSNIQAGRDDDFALQEKKYLDTLNTPYDFGSLMHYGAYVFSKDGNSPTITPKFEPHANMGQRKEFSPLDIWKITTLYGCEAGPMPMPDYLKFMPNSWYTGLPSVSPPQQVNLSSKAAVTSEMSGNKPDVDVWVLPHAIRINWNSPANITGNITGYVLSYNLEPHGTPQKIQLAPDRLAYYLSTYTSHPGRRYAVTISTVVDGVEGEASDPVTVRSACEQNVWLDNERFDKIHSPFFKDGYYEQDVVCQWKIRKPLRQVLNISFTSLDLTGDASDCSASGDFVRIGVGRYFCGSHEVPEVTVGEEEETTVTFVSRAGGAEEKRGGFSLVATAQGFAPENLRVEQMLSAFNVSWQPPNTPSSQPVAYVIRYKMASSSMAKEITVSPERTYFLLSTYPHFGVEYSIEVYARFDIGNGESAGPVIIRSKCSRNITVTGNGEHLNSPNYPSNYEPDTVCDWNIFPMSGHEVSLNFEQASFGTGDYVDVISAGASFARFDTSFHPTHALTFSAPVKVIFKSDFASEASGFRINLSSIPVALIG
ncbi:uncharacterized protein LOC127858415 [Dreissena polymorpha]|uniref:Metalloendopeptidase n=1 Tax=Dreissena polymorpha TaxID=45954 RepID=A0A9D3Z362_DREPO|nr:uncharacterized protein LOC127858415 [Dreissena polymorpha]KAH3709931.1 hypothetical protein DPMN_069397 [Dreissena polymorpha]